MVYNNQEKYYNLLIKAITLVIIFLHVLLLLFAKFNFEILWFEVINIFMYANLDKIIFIKMLLKYNKQSKVFKLNKALYDLY